MHFRLEVSLPEPIAIDCDYFHEQLVVEHTAEIVASDEDDGGDKQLVAGTIEFHVVKIGVAMRAGIPRLAAPNGGTASV